MDISGTGIENSYPGIYFQAAWVEIVLIAISLAIPAIVFAYLRAADGRGAWRLSDLPCPFCGGEVDPAGYRFAVSATEVGTAPACVDCGATTPDIQVWNSRVSHAGLEEVQ